MSVEKYKYLSFFLLIAATSQVFAVGASAEDQTWSDGPVGFVAPLGATYVGGQLTRKAFKKSSEIHGAVLEAEAKAAVNQREIQTLEKELGQLRSQIPYSPKQIEDAEHICLRCALSRDEVLRAELIRMKMLGTNALPAASEVENAMAILNEQAKHPVLRDLAPVRADVSRLRGVVLQFETQAAKLKVDRAKATRAGSIFGLLTTAAVGVGVGEVATSNQFSSYVTNQVSKGVASLMPSDDEKPQRPSRSAAASAN